MFNGIAHRQEAGEESKEVVELGGISYDQSCVKNGLALDSIRGDSKLILRNSLPQIKRWYHSSSFH